MDVSMVKREGERLTDGKGEDTMEVKRSNKCSV